MVNKKHCYIILLLLLVNYSIYLILINFGYNSKQEISLTRLHFESKRPKLVRIGKENETSQVTIVTLMFHVSKSKHSMNDYKLWFETMTESLGQPFVAYVDKHWSESFIRVCNKRNLTGHIYIFDSIWHIMVELESNRNRTYMESYRSQQYEIDPEKKIHSPELYAIWNLKLYLFNKSANLNPFESTYFLYTDCGAWRFGVLSDWPDIQFVNQVGDRLVDRMLLGEYNQPDPREFSIFKDYMQAGFFLGSAKAIRKFSHEYYLAHDEWLDKVWFVGKEQNLLNYLTFFDSKHLVSKLLTRHRNCKKRYDMWFFYLFYFAHKKDFICSVDRLSILKL